MLIYVVYGPKARDFGGALIDDDAMVVLVCLCECYVCVCMCVIAEGGTECVRVYLLVYPLCVPIYEHILK